MHILIRARNGNQKGKHYAVQLQWKLHSICRYKPHNQSLKYNQQPLQNKTMLIPKFMIHPNDYLLTFSHHKPWNIHKKFKKPT